MLAIRMQRTGRKGHAQFRVVVQDSRQTPSSGKLVALVGNYDPHTKTANLVKDKIEFYMEHGAQPSERAALLFKKEGIKLPKWVEIDSKKQGKLRNPEKLRKNQPADAAPKVEEPKAEESVAEQSSVAAPEAEASSEPTEAPAEEASETPAEEPEAEEKPTQVVEEN